MLCRLRHCFFGGVRLKQDIEWQIKQWGLWSRKDGTGKLSNSASPMFEGIPRASYGEPLIISDEQAIVIERAILRLKTGTEKQQEQWVVLMLLYFHNLTQNEAAYYLKKVIKRTLSRPTIISRREGGVASVESYVACHASTGQAVS